jgi:hypothetical protein
VPFFELGDAEQTVKVDVAGMLAQRLANQSRGA